MMHRILFSGDLAGFNVSWLRSGHPVLNVGDLSIEASKSLGSMLDQLRFPRVKSLSNLAITVLISRYILSFGKNFTIRLILDF